MKTTIFIVTIPWDSASVGETYAFHNLRDAEEFCTKKNAEGYNGYCGGLHVARCELQ